MRAECFTLNVLNSPYEEQVVEERNPSELGQVWCNSNPISEVLIMYHTILYLNNTACKLYLFIYINK